MEIIMAENGTDTAAKPAKKEVVRIPVLMKDGRTLEFTERQKCSTRYEGDTLYFDFRSGDTIGVSKADVSALSERFMWHGVEQKYRDEFASAGDAADAFEWVTNLHERIKRGEWAEKREGGGLAGAGLLVQALVEITGKTPTEIRAFLGDKSRKEQEILRDHGPIAEKIKEIKARKGANAEDQAKAASLFAAVAG
jgi:hypothetical protein